MKEKNNPLHVSFSRVLGITDAMALAAGFLLAQLFVMGTDISKTLGSEAPLSVLIGGVLFFPVLLALMERASEVRGSANLYELSRLSYSKQLTFFTGWLILGGYICLCVLFAWGVGLRIGVGLEHMLGTSVLSLIHI